LLAAVITALRILRPTIFPRMYSEALYSENRKESRMNTAFKDYLPGRARLRAMPGRLYRGLARRLRKSMTMSTLLLASVLLLCASVAIYGLQAGLAGRNNADACNWYTVESGDTLTNIAASYHTTISTLAHVNSIRNVNMIFVSQRICIPTSGRSSASGITANGTVRWYAYDALDSSNRTQVRRLLYQVADSHHLPRRLLLAIAWQESGWTQHVIAWDGGIGVMQLMPYTAMSVNSGLGQRLDPYSLWDNLNLGATYLEWLYHDFNGDLPQVISAYNEGGWAVEHEGIFNWQYVNNVLALMKQLS